MRASTLVLLLLAASAASALRPADPCPAPSRGPGQDGAQAPPGEGLGTPLVAPAPAIPLTPPVLEGWEEEECARCHATVAAEWARSAHALAWVDHHYQASLEGKRRPASCHGCHIPEPLLTSGELPPRVRARGADAADAHLGIRCVTCHAGPDGTILGPAGHATEAHQSVRSPYFRTGDEAGEGKRSDALCAACHSTTIGPVVGLAKDFEKAGMAARGLSCVGCHMAPVERRWAGGAEEAAGPSLPLRRGRSHALQTPRDPAFLRLAFGWSLAGEAGARLLVLENQAGHRVPGLVGRTLSFGITSLGPDGAELGTESLVLDTSAYLPVDGSRQVALASGAVSARVVGEHVDPRGEEPLEFLSVVVTAE